MKKKLLTFLFAICLIIPCALIMTACDQGGDPPPPPAQNGSININGINDYVLVTPADAVDCNDYDHEATDGNYAVWLADFYDKDTLEVCFDETPLTLTSCVESSLYYDRTISLNIRKIATFLIPAEYTGEHNINVSVEEQELTVRFVTNDQEFSEEELNILDNYHITSMGGRTFRDMMLNDYRLYTTYSQITNQLSYSDGIEFTGDKRLGYYVSHQIVKAVDPSIELHNLYKKQANNNYSYSFVINADSAFNGFNGFESTNILLTFDKENLKVSNFYFTGTNLDNEILSCKVNGVELAEDKLISSLLWKPTDDGDIKLYIEPYVGVDLSNVEVYVNDTKMTINEEGGKKYITIPKDSLPIEYIEDDGDMVDFMYEAKTFVIDIRNIVVSQESELYTKLEATSNSSKAEGSVFAKVYYENQDSVCYFIPNTETHASYMFNDTIENSTLVVKGHSISLDYYLVTHDDVPNMDENWTDRYQTTTQNGLYYHYVLTFGEETIVIDVAFDLVDNSFARYITVAFIATGPTTVSLTCE